MLRFNVLRINFKEGVRINKKREGGKIMAPETTLAICKCRGKNPGCAECEGSGFAHIPIKKEYEAPQPVAEISASDEGRPIV